MARRVLPKIHPTEIQDWFRCPRIHKYARVERLQPSEEAVALGVGTAGHKALQDYYTGKESHPHISFLQYAGERASLLVQEYKDGALAEKLEKEVTSTAAVLAMYPTWAEPQDAFTVMQTEAHFEVPIKKKNRKIALLTGTFDLVVRSQDTGQVWVVDHKFWKRFSSDSVLRRDMQFSCYIWAARQIWPEKEFGGLILNVVRKYPAKTKDTPNFDRSYWSRSEEFLTELEGFLPSIVEGIQKDKLRMPHPGLHCSWCKYPDLCDAESNQTGWEELAALRYTIREDPLEDKEVE